MRKTFWKFHRNAYRLVYMEVFVFLIFVPILLVNKSLIFLVFLCSHCNNEYLYQHWLHRCCFLRLAAVLCLGFSTVLCFTSVIKSNNGVYILYTYINDHLWCWIYELNNFECFTVDQKILGYIFIRVSLIGHHKLATYCC